jgi:hypothetical protein
MYDGYHMKIIRKALKHADEFAAFALSSLAGMTMFLTILLTTPWLYNAFLDLALRLFRNVDY